MPATAEAEAARRGGIKGYRTVKRGNRTILVAIVPKPGPRGGHTVSMHGPVKGVSPAPASKKMSKKRLKRLAKKRKARNTAKR